MTRSKSYEASLLAALRDRQEAAEYLTAALADGDRDVFLLALRHVADAHGGVGKLAGRARLNRVSMYRMLSAHGNPELRSLGMLLDSLGLRLAVEVRRRRARRRSGVTQRTTNRRVRRGARVGAAAAR